MLKRFILTIQLVIIALLLNAQNKSKPHKLYFNKEGKWVNGFPIKINTDSHLFFKKSKADTIYWILPTNLDTIVFSKIKTANDSIVNFDNEDSLKAFLVRRPQLLRLFQNDSVRSDINTDSAIANFKIYINQLKIYYEELTKSKNFKNAAIAANTKYFPGLETNLKQSFKILAKNQYGNSITIDTNEFKWKDETNIGFSIYRDLKDNQAIQDHYKNNFPKYINSKWVLEQQENLNSKNKKLVKSVDSLLDKWNYLKKTGETVEAEITFENLLGFKNEIQTYYSELKKLEDYIIQENREWIKSWLWFTNWEPVLNPFNLTNPENDKRISELKTYIDSIKDNIGFLTKFIDNKNIKRFENFSELKSATEQLSSMNVTLKKSEKELKRAEQIKNDFHEGLKALKTDKQLLHYGELFFSKKNSWKPMRFHDYCQNFELLNKTETTKYYWDGDDEKIVAANIPKGINVALIDKIEEYTAKSSFSTAIDPILDGFIKNIDDNLATLLPQVKSITPLLQVDKEIDNRNKSILVSQKNIENNNKAIVEIDKNNFTFSDSINKTVNKINSNNKAIQNQNIVNQVSFTNKTDTIVSQFKNFKISFLSKNPDKYSLAEFEKYKHAVDTAFDFEIAAIKKIVNQVSSLFNITKIIEAGIKEKETLTELNTHLKTSIDQYKKQIDELEKIKIRLLFKAQYDSLNNIKNWFSKQSDAFTPYDLSTADDTLFRTIAIGPKAEIQEGNKKNTYTIYKRKGQEKEEKVAEWQYKRYPSLLLDPISGPVFISESRGSLIYNPTTQTFTTEDLGRSDMMLGIKYHPFKIWIEDKRFLGRSTTRENIKRGVSYLNRLAITGGVGIRQSPLRNFFTGVSYDIITGLSFNYGFNFYTKKDYQIKNGVIEKEFETFTSTRYWGVTIAPVTLLKMLRIINLKP